MSDRKIAVIGASGVVGRALLEQLTIQGEDVTGLSRRPPADLPDVAFVQLDLLDACACRTLVANELADVTHLVYTALYEKPGLIQGWREADQMQTNLSMLRNILTPVSECASLRHVTLLQGTKAYGAHVTAMKIPGLERDPRHDHKNFYWLQQDHLIHCAAQQGFDYTIWRPQIIFGHALHAPMNMLAAIGVYAALMKAQGSPLSYPGGPDMVTEAIDADLLAEAIAFSFDNPAFYGETFNITNGDVFRWQDIWPAIADMFDMPVGQPANRLLSAALYDAEPQWRKIVQDHALQSLSIREIVGDSFYYADALFNAYGSQAPPPALLSTIKLRQVGFAGCVDTEQMFAKWFERLRVMKLLPG